MANKKLKPKPASAANPKASAELRSSDWLGIFSKRVQSRLTGEYAAKYHPGWYPESNKPITSLAELCSQTEQALLKRMGFGKRAMQEVRSKLVERGMSLATDQWGIAASLRATKDAAKMPNDELTHGGERK